MMVGALAGLKVLHHFIPDLKPSQMNDAKEFLALFPDLALLKF
jgi:hypothetical protein